MRSNKLACIWAFSLTHVKGTYPERRVLTTSLIESNARMNERESLYIYIKFNAYSFGCFENNGKRACKVALVRDMCIIKMFASYVRTNWRINRREGMTMGERKNIFVDDRERESWENIEQLRIRVGWADLHKCLRTIADYYCLDDDDAVSCRVSPLLLLRIMQEESEVYSLTRAVGLLCANTFPFYLFIFFVCSLLSTWGRYIYIWFRMDRVVWYICYLY